MPVLRIFIADELWISFKKQADHIDKALTTIIQQNLNVPSQLCHILYTSVLVCHDNPAIYIDFQFRQKTERHASLIQETSQLIAELFHQHFNVSCRLRAFAIPQEKLWAVDILSKT